MKRRAPNGFTLIEALVTVFLTALALVTIGSIIRYFYTANAGVVGQWQHVEEARREVEAAATAFRAGTSTSVSYPFSDFLQPTFTYYDTSGAALTEPIDPAQVSSVLISAAVGNTTIFSGAALRNRTASSTP